VEFVLLVTLTQQDANSKHISSIFDPEDWDDMSLRNVGLTSNWLHGVISQEIVQYSRGRSQWPRRLKDELSSAAWTLESWVRISLEALLSVCVYFICVVLCVGSDLATGRSPVQGVLPSVYGLRNWKNCQGPTKGSRDIDELMSVHEIKEKLVLAGIKYKFFQFC
jgi:hypothetical protein